MITATIKNVSEKIIPSKIYSAEELLWLLMKIVDYKVEVEEFNEKESEELIKQSKIDEISFLID